MKTRGYTLVEMLVIISVIAIIGTVAVVNIKENSIRKANNARRIADLAQFQRALSIYKTKYGFYPCESTNDPNNVGGTIGGSGSCPASTTTDEPGFLNGTSAIGTPTNCTFSPTKGLFSEGLLNTNCPQDPKNIEGAGPIKMIYVYQADTTRQLYVISAYLEGEDELMANDGGTCDDLYEVGPGTGILQADPLNGDISGCL